MNRKIPTVHLAWGAAAVTAFVLGKSDFSGANSSETAGDRTTGRESRSSDSRFGAVTEREARSRVAGARGEKRENGGRVSDIFGASTFAALGIDGLAEEALKSPNPILRRLAFGKLLEAMTPENAQEMRAKLLEMGVNGSEWHDFNYSYGALAGMDAVELASESTEQDLSAIVSGWAAANPQAALAKLDDLPASMTEQRNQIAEAIVSGLADTDRTAATELVLRLSAEGNERAGNMMSVVANEMVRGEGAEAAAAWSRGLPDGPLKGAAMDRIANDFVRQDPQGAAQWAAQFAANDFAAGAVERVGGQWGRQDPKAAASWLEELPQGKGQNDGLNRVFSDWEDSDPVAAGNHLLAMPVSEKRDSALSGFSRGYAWQDPNVAIAYAGLISDPTMRQQSLTQVAQAYFRRDPDAASAWLGQSGLPPEVQAKVQSEALIRR